MKPNRPQPTSYKNFLQQMSKNNSKTEKSPLCKPQRKPIQLVRKSKHNSSAEILPHSKSTSFWQKSTSKRTWIEDPSIQSKIMSHNESLAAGQSHKKQKQSSKDKMICYHKFINEITTILTEIIKIKTPEFLNHKISYIEFLEVLKSMKMIKQNYEPFPNDIVCELWGQLISGYNIGNMIIIISIILGIQYEKKTESDIQIKNKYQQLKYTRFQLNSRNMSSDKNDNLFMPQISQRSQQLATSRSKSKEKVSRHKKCLHTERVHTSGGFVSQQSNQNFCFNSRQFCGSSIDKTGNKRSELLYRQAKQKSAQKRKDKSTNEVEYEKSIKQMTLKPKIHRYKSKQNLKKNKIKGQQNNISRIIRGRVEREVMKTIKEKGVPYNQKMVDKMKRQKYEQIINTFSINSEGEEIQNQVSQVQEQIQSAKPVQNKQKISYTDLRVDVYIAEDHKQELIVEKGDSLQKVALKFIKQHNICEQKLEQLIDLLQKSMKHVLLPIDQMAEEQEQQLLSARGQNRKFLPY